MNDGALDQTVLPTTVGKQRAACDECSMSLVIQMPSLMLTKTHRSQEAEMPGRTTVMFTMPTRADTMHLQSEKADGTAKEEEEE